MTPNPRIWEPYPNPASEERIVVFATPARATSTSTLALLSLMPGLLPSHVEGVYGTPTHDVGLSTMGLPLEALSCRHPSPLAPKPVALEVISRDCPLQPYASFDLMVKMVDSDLPGSAHTHTLYI